MADDKLKEVYMEIISFMYLSGPTYNSIDEKTLDNLIESLYSGQYILIRDAEGRITNFCNYWLVEPSDLETLKHGGKPHQVNSGSIVFVVDHVSKSGTIRDMVRQLRRKTSSKHGVAFFHKWCRPELFRYFPSQRGSNDG